MRKVVELNSCASTSSGHVVRSLRVVPFLAVLIAGAMLTGATSASGLGPVRWVATDLETLARPNSYARDINLRAQIVGHADTKDEQHAALWQSRKAIDLGTLNGTTSIAIATSDSGEVVGWSTQRGCPPHAFVWRSVTMIDVGPPGTRSSEATAISAHGEVIGVAITQTKGERAFYWHNGTWSDIGAEFPLKSIATAINGRAQVIGDWRTRRFDWRAYLWKAGKTVDLGTLGGSVYPRAINERGQVVGISETSRPGSAFMHAFLWSAPDARPRNTRRRLQQGDRDQRLRSGRRLERDPRGRPPCFPLRGGRMEDLSVGLDTRVPAKRC